MYQETFSAVSDGLKTTIELLATTANEAAVRVLVPALDSPDTVIREEALSAILRRRSAAGHREVLRRLHLADERTRQLIANSHSRMLPALRDAVLGSDVSLCSNACLAAIWLRQYDLIPTLITLLEGRTGPGAVPVGQTLVQLAEQLYAELAEPRHDVYRENPQTVRRRVIGDLEKSVARFGKHKRREIVDAFVLLVPRDNATLKQILMDPHHAAFVAVVETLSKSAAGGAIRLLLSFLDDPHAPSVALLTISKRSDRKFIERLLGKVGDELGLTVRENLKRLTAIPWLQSGSAILDALDDRGQHGAVRLVMHSGIPREEVFRVVGYVLLHGKPGGRRAAAQALGEFRTVEANRLALRALEDPDPQVQANVLVQLRCRGIPDALPRLVDMLDSPHEVVRQAAKDSLAEFTFHRFVAAFDMLDEEVRRSTGSLVKKVDPETLPLLEAEMCSQLPARRRRALAIAQAIEAVPLVEAMILRLLKDEEHIVRAEAAAALAEGRTAASLEALEEATGDRSISVQEAARKSLRRRRERGPRLEVRTSSLVPEGAG